MEKVSRKKVNVTVDKEVMGKGSQKTKLHDIGPHVGLKKYLKDLRCENSRTVFEVRTNMLKLNSNYGQTV